jgi:hypothetical protein
MRALAGGFGRLVTRKAAGVSLLGVLGILQAVPAAALVVDPFFAGHQTTTLAYPDPYFVDINFQFSGWPSYVNGSAYISPNGFIDNGGFYSGTGAKVGNWSYFDFNIIAPLWNNVDLSQGGQITYGNPTPDTFAVSWVNVHNSDDPSVVNTFQVVLIGGTGFKTNTGVAIAPGSIIFGYGNGVNGTVNLTASSPAAIGLIDLNGSVQTLTGLGIGGADGVVGPADLPALLASGDPFLFNLDPNHGYAQPLAFQSVPGLSPVPEPAVPTLLAFGLAAAGLARRRGLTR